MRITIEIEPEDMDTEHVTIRHDSNITVELNTVQRRIKEIYVRYPDGFSYDGYAYIDEDYIDVKWPDSKGV